LVERAGRFGHDGGRLFRDLVLGENNGGLA
jgi:hypothetical protein